MTYFDFPKTGDYTKDCAAGRAYAESIMQDVKVFPGTIGFAAKAMMDAGEFDGRHAGFFNRIAESIEA